MSELASRTLKYEIPQKTVEITLEFLKRKAHVGHEGVVLWPGRLGVNSCAIALPYIPDQITGPFRYQIPREAVIEILGWSHRNNHVIPIQVHSHLFDAFHSEADDELAFVQHENGISIVVPDGGYISAAEFAVKAKFFRLVGGTTWEELPRNEVRERFQWAAEGKIT
jgi:hypothetical protein